MRETKWRKATGLDLQAIQQATPPIFEGLPDAVAAENWVVTNGIRAT
jgi:hypothetical protein